MDTLAISTISWTHEKQLANLTKGSKIDREVTSRTMKLLGNETKQLKEDYMKLQSETRA